ncbi:tyrosine-type recombinase/integrase [Streptosporangium canum]|uniref:tyrosine-type recombinase/integrase n=1 Tax=Streptosporangium canum TaxID=324952 RepID=UPI00342EBF39
MSALREQAEDYLAMRRALGFKLTTWGDKLLSFVGYLESTGASVITTEAAVAWATSTPRASTDPVHWARRMDVVRIFARHLKVLDPATEVPPEDVLSHRYRRITPYLYSPAEITGLLQAAGRLAPQLRAETWQTVLGLLAVTGLRVSEACRLDRDDVDLRSGVLTVRDSKFGKSRDVPVHESTAVALRRYDRLRDHLCPATVVPSFFVSTCGTRLDAANMPADFAGLLKVAGIAPVPGRRRQRIHDLRHTFTVATLLEWYQAGADVQARLPLLATYLGHIDPKSTYWYLSGSPELLSLVAARLEHAFGDRDE